MRLEREPGFFGEQAVISTEAEQVGPLGQGSEGDVEEAAEFAGSTLGGTVGDVGGDGERGPAHLNRQAKSFRAGPRIRGPIQLKRQVMRGTPGVETLVGDRFCDLSNLRDRRFDLVVDTCAFSPDAVAGLLWTDMRRALAFYEGLLRDAR